MLRTIEPATGTHKILLKTGPYLGIDDNNFFLDIISSTTMFPDLLTAYVLVVSIPFHNQVGSLLSSSLNTIMSTKR